MTALRAPLAGVAANARTHTGSKAQIGAYLVALMCVTAYTMRSSLPAYLYGSSSQQLFLMIELASLVMMSGYAILQNGVWPRLAVLVMAGATGVSVVYSENPSFSGVRWLAWIALLMAAGPANNTAMAKLVRRFAWRQAITVAIVVTLLSALWAAAGLPNLGRGDFTGVMWHSMVLAPLAAIVGVLAIVRFAEAPKLEWGLLYVVAAGVTMIASSRSALVALAFATLIAFALRMKRYPLLSFGSILLSASLLIAPDGVAGLLGGAAPSILTEGLANKSLNNSREYHWQARWDEFESSPYTGVGFAYGWLDTAGVDDSGSVESGSSYVGVLSMTGLVGVAGCLALPLAALWGYIGKARRLPLTIRTEIACFAGFWFVHLGAEGYLYAVGSIMGLFVWLWFGRLFDLLDDASKPAAQTRVAATPRHAVARPRVPGRIAA